MKVAKVHFCSKPHQGRNTFITFARDKNMVHLMNKSELDVTYFISFCIEQYKKKNSMQGREVMELFDRYGVLQ